MSTGNGNACHPRRQDSGSWNCLLLHRDANDSFHVCEITVAMLCKKACFLKIRNKFKSLEKHTMRDILGRTRKSGPSVPGPMPSSRCVPPAPSSASGLWKMVPNLAVCVQTRPSQHCPLFPSTPACVGSANSTVSDRGGSSNMPGGVPAL